MDVATCLSALAAAWLLARMLPGVEYVAPVTLALAGGVAFLAIVDGERSPILFGVPALMLVLLLLPGERERLLASGLVFAACLAAAAIRWNDGGSLSVPRGVVLVAAAFGPVVAIPADGGGPAAALIAGAGAIAIVIVSAVDRRVVIDVVMIANAAALAAPAVPVRAALFPFVVAALILVLRKPGSIQAGALVLLVLAAGKWYLPILVAAGAGFALERLRSTRGQDGGRVAPAIALPAMWGSPAAALAALTVAPDVLANARRAETRALVTAVLLTLAGLFVQPSLALISVLSAVAVLVSLSRREGWSLPLAVVTLAMSGLTAWSGVIAGAFPLPLPLAVLVLIASGAWAASRIADRGAGIASAAVAGLAATLVVVHPGLEPERPAIASDLRIPAGEAVTIPLPEETRAVRLEVSGGNIAGLHRGVVIAVVRAEPGGEARELRVGDFADWGVARREHFLAANNPRVPVPAGPVLGSGRTAFLSGAGVARFETSGAQRLTIEVPPSIGQSARLLVAVVEAEP